MSEFNEIPDTVTLVFLRNPFRDTWEFKGIATNEKERRQIMVAAETTPKSGQAVWREYRFEDGGTLRDPPPPNPKTAWERIGEDEG